MGRSSSPEFGRPHKILYGSPEEKASREAENGLLQFDELIRVIEASSGILSLNREIVLRLHKLAINGLYGCAGEFRDGYVGIGDSRHVPPNHKRVPSLVDEMCEYANSHQGPDNAIHVAAYLLWRVNWIHPFFGGNGRTARAISYIGLSVGFAMVLPGSTTVVDQLVKRSDEYYEALQAADKDSVEGESPNVRKMEMLISDMFATQLEDAI